MAVRNIERELEALSALRNTGSSEPHTRALRKALHDKVNLIVARAAKVTGELQISELIPELCSAFDRLMNDPLKTDPKCWGKEAIATALKELGHADSTVFRKGLQHAQFEPVWGGEEDTAGNLRATCALALLQCNDITREEKFWCVMPLLSERSPSLRKDGAMALEALEGREAALLLRIKARMGDEDSTVTGQIFESLLRVERDAAVPFVVEFLKSPNPEVSSEAALALGASRLPPAVSALKVAFGQKFPSLDHDVLCRALSISRQQEAIEFLLDKVRHGRLREAVAALEALHLYRDSAEIRQKVSEAVSKRSEAEMRRTFKRFFEEPSSA
jgi:HEAT repeat protein